MRTLLSALAIATMLSGPALAASGKLVLYTSQPNEDAQETVDAFTAKHPDVEVEWIRDGTTKVMAKLAAEFEAGAPQPDVLLIADMVTMEGLKAEGRLMAHEGADISAYDPAIMDDEKFYFSTKLITTGIVYNTAAEMVPTSYTDLLDEAAKDRIAMPSPLTSGAATIHMAALTANPDLGWAYYEGLADQGANPQGGNGGTYRAIAGGEKLYGFVVDFLPIREKANGAPVEFVFPEEGVSAVTEPVAILSTAQNPEAAKAFVDFLLSPEGQQLAADQGYLAAHPDIAPPEGFPARDQIKLMDFDPAAALENDAANKERFVDIFGG
ncbi:MAG: ABC transporter substrate-binding protein [Roseitalea sp.]|jgi:iron(III) transport system substrate-binding protein|uniref:Extracellular solute-binding protein n=1 Tax=Oceaniradius stylonematis TaxID=2184161 RepID=A0A3A8AJG1_9HYPH|nr:ABC transporter substrate-binding protein [Oceaniradius stylonematis]MBO6551531.1 ABC transporter substrate-binding protein [Roseitalea sp.]MBO6952089.1 ABC transporter substrate-binding protein [Rhizobiaceae bacterium]RNC95513.1 MAG: extracellular solute-binding protein [Oricola sp.]MBO6592065.1 ABC transporter substrate-binding protein [Roseitalea sp.]MBO6598320.1 ABC transporter substrate-binding protein [Roseitalea sp.]